MEDDHKVEVYKLDQAHIIYHPMFLNVKDLETYFNDIYEGTPWRKDKIKLFGKEHWVPRLQAWYGDPGAAYTYSNIALEPLPWTASLMTIKKRIEVFSGTNFNSVLLNLYRDGKDGNGWHSDDEKELGKNPTIASLSLGQSRKFHLKHKSTGEKISFDLISGSLLIMKGETQHFWKHQIPKTKRPIGPRINLTFRRIFT